MLASLCALADGAVLCGADFGGQLYAFDVPRGVDAAPLTARALSTTPGRVAALLPLASLGERAGLHVLTRARRPTALVSRCVLCCEAGGAIAVVVVE